MVYCGLVWACLLAAPPAAKASGSLPAIIPAPRLLEARPGVFQLTRHTALVVEDEQGVRAVVEPFVTWLNRSTGYALRVSGTVHRGGTPGAITVRTRPLPAQFGEEGYRLVVEPGSVLLEGASPRALAHGLATLRQLLPAELEGRVRVSRGRWPIPCVRIEDWPRYRWRGLMLDSSRCFLHMPFLKRYLDVMAYYKLNVLHWHLTDDEGWRPDIVSRPRLTEVGSLHAANANTEGGFYTQADMREIVEYARGRGIEILPEIEMPGHALAALTAYPELGCRGGPYSVPHDVGVFADVLCPGRDETFRFVRDVLGEVCAIFPSKLIHLGGDEVQRTAWHDCVKCQERMRTEGLRDEAELQSWFTRQVSAILAEHGRTLVGWDEILDGGLAPGAVVMSWRGESGGIAAARMGHDVVMSPYSHCYFDYDIGTTDVRKVYSYNPTPRSLTPAEARHVLGVQANMWTHLGPEPGIDGQVFPRLIALAEVGWTPARAREFEGFDARMASHYKRLDGMGVTYGPEGVAPPKLVRPCRIETTMPTYLDHTPERAFDGDARSSYFWSARGLAKGDTFTVTLDEPITAHRVRVLTGHPWSGHTRDVLLNGLLEISEDGKTFSPVAEFHGGDAAAEPNNRPLRAIRIRCLADQIEWLIIREIVIE